MAFTTGDNNFGTAKWIVDSTPGQGTHTTIAAAITAASSGQTIFIRPGTYTENLTLKAGVNLVANIADAFTPNVTIVGKATFTTAGSVSISGINFQTNSDFLLAVTGSANSVLFLDNCNINCTNNTGISFTTSGTGAQINMYECGGDLGTTGIAFFSHSSAGRLNIYYCDFTNTGGSVTANTVSGSGSLFGFWTFFVNPITTSGSTLAGFGLQYCFLSATNTTALTVGHTSVAAGTVRFCDISGGTASAISVGAGSNLIMDGANNVTSSNTNAITGSGVLKYGPISFEGTSSTVNTSTQTPAVSMTTLGASNTNGVVYSNGTNLVDTALGASGTVLVGTGSAPAFSATPSVTSITINGGTALSTYVTGTWTPGFSFGGGTTGITYSSQIGQYFRLGNCVFITFRVALSNKGSSTGGATLTGLPVTTTTTTQPSISLLPMNITYPVGVTELWAVGGASTSSFFIVGSLTAANSTQLTDTNFSNTSQVDGMGFYFIT